MRLCIGQWILSLFFLAPGFARAQGAWQRYSSVELLTETGTFAPGAVGTFGFKLRFSKGWHSYWLNPGDSGTPIRFKFETSSGAKVARVLFPTPEREVSGPLITFAYAEEVLIPIEVDLSKNLKPGDHVHIKIDAEWLVCDEVCIPAFDKLEKDVEITPLAAVKPSDDFARFQRVRRAIPVAVPDQTRFDFSNPKEATFKLPDAYLGDQFVDFFPFKGSGVTNVKPTLSAGVLHFEHANVPSVDPKRVGVLLVRSGQDDSLRAIQFGDSGWRFESQNQAPAQGLWWMLVSAFIGGLILNLMPCVFPILSIKLLSLLKLARAHPAEVRKQNLAYAGGVLFSFVGIALALSLLRAAGHLIGWGFQLQSPLFLAVLAWLFTALTLNLLGLFEIEFFDAGIGGALARKQGLAGSFFTGVLAVIVASPCTAPFMGVALGFGLAQPTVILIAVFVALGLGLASPYLVFAIFPSWAKILPRPGAWMKVVKQVMAIPLLLTTVWILWILGQVRGPNAMIMVLLGALALSFALTAPKRFVKIARVLAVLVLLGGAVFIYRSEHVAPTAGEKDAAKLWQEYSDERLASLKGANVFVNMTADWCLTCKVNERLVFDDLEVQALLKKKNVTWLRGDWTERNEAITRFLNRYDRVGVPFYVLFSPKNAAGLPLPEVLTKASFMDYINREF